MKISLTSVFVDDPVKAHKFYTEALGFQSKEFVPAPLIWALVRQVRQEARRVGG
jgi:hypothetical protein